MSDGPIILTCAKCGEKKEVCDSAWMEGIKQPRICKKCLLCSMRTGNYDINDLYWLIQLKEQGEEKSIEALQRQVENEQGRRKEGGESVRDASECPGRVNEDGH